MFAAVLPASAQKKKVIKKKSPKVEAPAENPRFTEMLSATQKVTFIDSVVINRDQLLDAFFTNAEEGRLSTYKDFFHAPGQASDIVYVNELGNKCIFSMNNGNGGMRLYSCDLLANEWSSPEPLKGLEEEGLLATFPFRVALYENRFHVLRVDPGVEHHGRGRHRSRSEILHLVHVYSFQGRMSRKVLHVLHRASRMG